MKRSIDMILLVKRSKNKKSLANLGSKALAKRTPKKLPRRLPERKILSSPHAGRMGPNAIDIFKH
eukprot:9371090-Pyramimonas_sp.AAC.1